MSTDTQPRLVAPGDGQSIDLGLGCPTIKLGPQQSSTQSGLVEGEIPPGGGFRVPHWHDDLDEVFYVLAGELEFLLGDQWVTARQAQPCSSPPARCTHSATQQTSPPASS